MKSKKYLSWLLCLSLLCTMLALPSAPVYAEESGKDSGIVLKKTATYNEADKSYTIRLEAYATGSKIVSTVTKDAPTDIVLVLDRSGSMADCIVCGQEISGRNNNHDTYKAVYTVDNNSGNTYFIKEGSTYTQVQYCSGSHHFLFWSEHCEGGAGWYTSSDRSEHTSDNKITPKKDSDHPAGTQFYVYESEACSPRMNALKSAATGFVNAVAKKAAGKDENVNTIDDNVNHRIAVVSYASNASNLTGGFKSMDVAGAADTVNRAINGLNANGGTMINDGISTANGIFASNPLAAGEKRNRVMIVFTDGAPGMYGDWQNSSTNTANSAISNAYTAKNTYGATVYTIGIFEGANASNPSSLPANNGNTNKTNRFMHLVSSNYKDAQSMTNTGSVNQNLNGGSYYLSAGDSSALNNIFEQISDQIESGGSSSTLTDNAVVKDVISQYFTLPEGADENSIKLETYACTGKNGDEYTWRKNDTAMGARATISEDGQEVSVTGFNFSDNYVGTVTENGAITGYRGHKLVISFVVKPKEKFLGGNGVPTNESAGVYENANAEKPVVSATVDPVDVQIKDVVIKSLDTNVYLGAQYGAIVNGSEIKNNMRLTIGGVEVDLTKPDENYGLADWQNEFVEIKVEVKDEKGNPVTNFEMLEDKKYSVTVTVTPKFNDAAGNKTPVSGNSKGTIHVFTPELTFKDSEVSYMASIADYGYGTNYVETKWRHQDEGDTTPKYSTDEDVTMLGNAQPPELTYEYTPDATRLTTDKEVKATDYVPVAVKVKLGETDVTNKTTFVHKCDVKSESTCEWAQVVSVNGNPAFLLHVKDVYADLTIKKSGANEAADPGQSFLFTVTGPDNYSTEVIIVGNDSVTLKNLKIGTYTVTENTGWSWRYTPDKESKEITLKANEKNEVTINNTRDKDQWLDGNVSTDNKFTGTAATTD